MQEQETSNPSELTDLSRIRAGRILSIDPGTKRIGVAVCDETRAVTRPLPRIERRSWKKLLADIKHILAEFDAAALVIGLPLRSDGGESPMSLEARNMARKFALSIEIPVFLQDERVTSWDARRRLWNVGTDKRSAAGEVDSEAAAIILEDFLDRIKA